MAIRIGGAARIRALAAHLGCGVEETARAVLDAASDKLVPVVQGLIAEYELDADQRLLIGEGGGAGALIPYISERLGLGCEISRDAEVISSIGAALALVRDVVERVIPHPQPEDLQAIRREALEAAVRVGADAGSVEVTVEVDPQTHRVRAIAVGAAEMHAKDLGGAITEREARAIAANSMGLPSATLRLVAETSGLRVYRTGGERLGGVRAVDRGRGDPRAAQPSAGVPFDPAHGGPGHRARLARDIARGGGPSRSARPVSALRGPRCRSLGGRDPRASRGIGGERAGEAGRRGADRAGRRPPGPSGLRRRTWWRRDWQPAH